MAEQRPWHRLFGMTWQDFFESTPVAVEPEKDMSVQQQRLDVLLRRAPGPIGREMPDGMEDLAAHNLVTFKSMHEAMDEWALLELIGHFVAYRKLASPSTDDLSPAEDFRLFAVCARSPQGLAGRVAISRLRDGVYDVPILTLAIRLIVVNELPLERRNAMLQLFAASPDVTQYGAENYEIRSLNTCSLLLDFIAAYREEGPNMAEAIEELTRRLKKEMLDKATPDELLARLTPEKRLEGIPTEKRLEGIPPEERLKGLTLDEIIAALPPDVLERLRARPGEKP